MSNSKMYLGSIDLNKIDKSKITTTDKNGQPFSNGAKYLNVVVWVNDQPDEYGNHLSIQQSITKEEKEKGIKATYLGNLKEYQSQANQTSQPNQNTSNNETEDLPF